MILKWRGAAGEDGRLQEIRDKMKKQLSFAFLKHGAERSMDGLEQDAPATTEQPLLRPLYQ